MPRKPSNEELKELYPESFPQKGIVVTPQPTDPMGGVRIRSKELEQEILNNPANRPYSND